MWSSQGLEGVLRGPEREEAGIQKGNWKQGLGVSCPTPKQALAWPCVISTDLETGHCHTRRVTSLLCASVSTSVKWESKSLSPLTM